ncbi:MAG: T9SS type A sorting domain-containing protein, partial [Candidatus Zixiibacteriota bacterium]
SGGVWSFTTSGAGVYSATFECIDSCGATCGGTVNITVDYNSAPVCNFPSDTSFFISGDSTFNFPVSATDVDNNLVGCSLISGVGTLSGGIWTFTTTGPGVYSATFECIDECGATCGGAVGGTVIVTVGYNSPPVCNLPGDTSYFVCDDTTFNFDVSATDVDGNLVGCSLTGGVGTLSGGVWSFTTSGPGVYSATFECIDSCGATCGGTVNITVDYNSGPIASCPGNSEIFVCDLSDVCIDGFDASDSDDNLESIIVTGGILDGNQVCFTPVVGINTITLIAVDECGIADTCTTEITVAMNNPPTATCPGDMEMFVCDLSTICIDGFACEDSDGNLASCNATGGVLSGSQVCFDPVAGTNIITLTATDSCGATDVCTTIVTITLNSPPTASCPPDEEIFLCQPEEISVGPFSGSDQDNNIASETVSMGILSGGYVFFTPTASGVYTIVYTVTDDCGETDVCQTNVTVTLNSAPVASCPGNESYFLCGPEEICVGPFSADDADGNLASETVSLGTLSGGNVCFTPDAPGDYTIVYTATDSCGAADACTTVVTVNFNSAPVCDLPDDDTLFICNDTVLSFSISATDADNNLAGCSLISGVGALSGGTWTFATTGSGVYSGTFECVDECGATCGGTVSITVNYNSAPEANCPVMGNLVLCNLDDICIEGFYCTDPDNNLVSCEVDNGVLDGTYVCFTPVEGPNTIILTATDACGVTAACTLNVNIGVDTPPTVSCPGDVSVDLCQNEQIEIGPFSASDIEGAIISQSVSFGTLSGNNVFFTPDTAGVYTIEYTAYDDCGVSSSCTTLVTVSLNNPPEVTCPANATIYLFAFKEVCLDGFAATDPDGNLDSFNVTGGVLIGSEVCFTPTEEGVYTITAIATDSCDVADTCETSVQIVLATSCPMVKIEKTHDAYQGHFENVEITIENLIYEIGGFDFLIAYDASALNFISAGPGTFMEECGWEFFTYRYGPFGNCGDACPSGMLRIVAMAETNNGANHPTCYVPPGYGPHNLINLKFYVTNDRTFECQYVPIKFFWLDCGDNTMTNPSGDTTFIDSKIFDFTGDIIWDEYDDDQFPEDARIANLGAPDHCLNPDPEKPSAIRCIEFWQGGIDIVCADSIDTRGDVNLNGLAYEISDAVVFTNYFINGLAAFTVNQEGQTAATDVNADGIVLSIADLVYLVRVVVGDALPYVKLTPGVEQASFSSDGSVVTVDAELGAALLLFEGRTDVSLAEGAANMEIMTGYDGQYTRVLVYSFKAGQTCSGRILNSRASLRSAEAADYYGSEYRIEVIPNSFSLTSYPNPFNPSATIEMTLPAETDWNIGIYNVAGQKVAEFGGCDQGRVVLRWDAGDVATGIYLMKATAGSNSVTRKMVLMK